jgi:hypothetical protein
VYRAQLSNEQVLQSGGIREQEINGNLVTTGLAQRGTRQHCDGWRIHRALYQLSRRYSRSELVYGYGLRSAGSNRNGVCIVFAKTGLKMKTIILIIGFLSAGVIHAAQPVITLQCGNFRLR